MKSILVETYTKKKKKKNIIIKLTFSLAYQNDIL